MQENRKEFDNTEHTLVIEGRNAVLEAFRSGSSILWEKSDFHRFP